MSKKRVGIYIDEDVWKAGNEIAYEHRVSFSEHVEKLLSGSAKFDFKDGPKLVPGNEQLDRIESKLDLLIPTEVTVLSDRVFEPGEVVEVDDLDEAILKAGQLRLEEKQRKIAELKKELGSTIHFSPQPKNKDKKGGK